MKINVKSLQGDEYLVEVQNDQLVSDLKASISEKANGLPIERQKLVYKGRTMQDISAVGEYNLEDGCKVHLILQKESPATTQLPSGATPSQASTSSNVTRTPTTAINSETKPYPMETAPTSSSSSSITSRIQNNNNNDNTNMTTTASPNAPLPSDPDREQSRFEIILRERLTQYLAPDDVEKIMVNLHHEINADINSSSLDDLERLAKQKLNISNE